MEGNRSNEMDSITAGVAAAAAAPYQQLNYNLSRVQEALEHLASIDLIELCNEAKIERCRATRDLRSCGRFVENVLNTCGHASLCTECCQRCDICPICRVPITRNGNKLRLRLYYECIEAGLISKKCDDRFQEKEGGEKQLTADIERLYSLFDVAMENNLVSLIFHYVTDVCMDESAVSSDPVIAFLLDEVVVKDWCKRTFKNILSELKGIYDRATKEMRTMLSSLLKISVKLTGVSGVIEVLESSFKGTLSAQVHDLHLMQESILKTKQHMEMMIWCIRHDFLENIKHRYSGFASWRNSVRERKAAATRRSWPESLNISADSSRNGSGTLFIEDALSNVEIEQSYTLGIGGDLEIAALQKDGSSSFFRSKIEGMAGCYPFENLRAAADILFLHGSSDLVVAKQAIFLYYLVDRHWNMQDSEWRLIIDDFAATFGVTRHSLLESFVFYMLDDHTDEAMQEAIHLLPEISGPTTHPKVAHVLLERQNPDAALLVLRGCGRDGTQLVSLSEAVTVVRVRVECGLLTEAFMYQRTLCLKVKEMNLKKKGSLKNDSDTLEDECENWMLWLETLVTEICYLCIRRNLVDRIIELPWNADEEKFIHKNLLDFAVDNPSTTFGSLLVVFYLQRYRYVEAYQVDQKLKRLEEEFISTNSLTEEVLSRMASLSQWRSGLVEKGIELLPTIQQQEVKDGKLTETAVTSPSIHNTIIPPKTDFPEAVQRETPTSFLFPSSITTPLKPDNNTNQAMNSSPSILLSGISTNFSPSFLQEESHLSNNTGTLKSLNSNRKKFKLVDIRSSGFRQVINSSVKAHTPLKEFNRSSLRVARDFDYQTDEASSEKDQNGFSGRLNHGRTSDQPGKSWKLEQSNDAMDVCLSGNKEDGYVNGGPRWRSDDTSEDELDESPDGYSGSAYYATPLTGSRRGRRLGRR
ncbi:E3 ubiquitin-protein ligase HOS1 isoform X2 [Impatiens glandulifera]|uniref:E3 ubiquitin-protein ligase HOS1 isoform X2 n=1 Tax=Impatiens glandulifera TaxID=253017 RepID=UPI001FB0AF4B|nr:E3 ubiquitin-protein ligase HOS1 isoform X2 [Impatiens glandulifera]